MVPGRLHAVKPGAARCRANHYGEEHFESDEAKVLGIVAAELRRRGWKEEELPARARSDKHKVAIAARLRRETTMTLKWSAQRLAMGSWNNVSNLLADKRRRKHQELTKV